MAGTIFSKILVWLFVAIILILVYYFVKGSGNLDFMANAFKMIFTGGG